MNLPSLSRFFRRSVAAFVMIAMVQTPSAFAADKQTHFYGTFLAEMLAGIPLDFAISMSVGNEMIDRGIWTNPMGLPTPRLLFHFMGTPLEFNVDEGMLKRDLAIATVKHPLFYNFLDTGLKTKNPVLIGAALHLLIDTFYHAGYSNLLGHGEAGHRPDMPYEEILKARACFQAIVEVMFIIRDMTTDSPDMSLMKRVITDNMQNPIYATAWEGITGQKTVDGQLAVISKRPDLFAQMLMDHELVRNTMFTNVEKSPQYWETAMKEIFTIFKQQGYTNLSEQGMREYAAQMSDITARTDLSPMQSLTIMLYRILQMQDPVIRNALMQVPGAAPDARDISKDFDFHKLAGFDSEGGFLAQTDIETVKNVDALKALIANFKIFVSKIQTSRDGETLKLQSSHAWSQATQTLAATTLPEVISWSRLLDNTGGIRPIEHREIGYMVSTQKDVGSFTDRIDEDPQYLEKLLNSFESMVQNPQRLQIAARLKSLSDNAYLLAHEATKDRLPGELGPLRHVIYEDDSQPHACFANGCRMAAAKNLVAELTNIKINTEPVGAHVYIVNQVKAGLAKVGLSKLIKTVNDDAELMDNAVREYVHSIGFGTKTADGKIVLPEDRGNLFEISPNLTLAGYANWWNHSYDYVYRIMMKTTKPKNAAIQEYIRNGEVMKTDVLIALRQAYYSGTPGSLPHYWTMKYGKLTDKPAADWNVGGVPQTRTSGLICPQALE